MTNFPCFSRRQVLKTTGAGFGYLALAGMLGQQAKSAEKRGTALRPLATRPPHVPTRAKRIIFLFMEGALSQIDTFEHKPQLQRDDGKTAPGGATLTGSKFKFARHGQTGTWVSELFPHVA